MLTNNNSSIIDPYYSSGDFFNSSTGFKDAEFKVKELLSLLEHQKHEHELKIRRIADVGCGRGDTTIQLDKAFNNNTTNNVSIEGFDVYPEVMSISTTSPNVQFHYQDFCTLPENNELYDLVVLFDVIEHVPDPISFLKTVSKKTKAVALHIPLDNTWFGWLRLLPRTNLSHPGHLVILDVASALNLLTFAGLRTRDFAFTPVFRAPSGKVTRAQRLLNPFRRLLYALNPYLLHKSLGGVSLIVVAHTPIGLETL